MTQQLRWAVEAWKSKFCGATLSPVSDPAAGEGGGGLGYEYPLSKEGLTLALPNA